MYSRRDVAKIALGVFSAGRLLAKPNSTIRGVSIGIQSRSFRDRTLDEALAAMVRVGIGNCELWEGHVAPPRMTRKGLREWRESIAIEQFQLISSSFGRAGVKILAYNYDFDEDFSDRETERGFEMAKALGTGMITASPPPGMARRLNASAAKAGILLGLRNGDGTTPGQLSSPEDLAAAMRGNPNIGICLDLGDFAAAGYDAVQFITSHLDRTLAVGLRDRKKNHGESVPFGQGDTPVAVALKLIQGTKAKAPALIDYDYKGGDPVAEVDRCYAFCRQVLMAKFTRP
jgi:sugar phosphate isomerase/epimerase